ncbi:hypothetical protein JOB18_014026 [Solea senegalensis]|uniref:Uncharacterized protein n=1 Tax=Solea senegalensis TaxID=28829 RepID=A0AAV6QTY4_SOLSE|nr:hypothetical protein JOB18_014026 [Solea senegalensis]
MSAAALITTLHQQLSLLCEKHSHGLKAFLRIKGASDGGSFSWLRCTETRRTDLTQAPGAAYRRQQQPLGLRTY